VQVALIIAATAFRNDFEGWMEDGWRSLSNGSRSWVEEKLHCCGFHNSSHFLASCEKGVGCWEAFEKYVRENVEWVVIAGGENLLYFLLSNARKGIAWLCQITGLVISSILCCKSRGYGRRRNQYLLIRDVDDWLLSEEDDDLFYPYGRFNDYEFFEDDDFTIKKKGKWRWFWRFGRRPKYVHPFFEPKMQLSQTEKKWRESILTAFRLNWVGRVLLLGGGCENIPVEILHYILSFVPLKGILKKEEKRNVLRFCTDWNTLGKSREEYVKRVFGGNAIEYLFTLSVTVQ